MTPFDEEEHGKTVSPEDLPDLLNGEIAWQSICQEAEHYTDQLALKQVMFRLYQLEESGSRVQRYLSSIGKPSCKLSELEPAELQKFAEAMKKSWLKQPREYQQAYGQAVHMLQVLGLSWQSPIIAAFLKKHNAGDNGISLEMLQILVSALRAEYEEIQKQIEDK